MATSAKPICKRILLKLSGGALQGTEDFGININISDRMAQEIKELVELGIQVGAVIGEGNLFRSAGLARAGMNRVVDDHMGMLATVMNGLAMRDALHRAYMNARLMSAILLNGVCDDYNWVKAINLLRNNRMMILSASAGNPSFTADSTACLRSIEIGAGVVLKAARVNGIFTADPAKDPTIAMYEQLTYNGVLEKELKAVGLMAFALARDHKLPIHVFDVNKSGTLRRVVMGEKEGTLITE